MAATESRIRLVFDGVSKGVVAAAAQARAAVKSIGDGTDGVTKKINDFGDKYTATITTVARRTALLSSAFAAAGGLAGQAFAGALPAVVALGAAGATVALGMDGIKKAAGQLKGPFDQLKKSVSATFAESLTAPFKQLAGIVPKLTSGFRDVAVSISGVVSEMIGFVSSTQGVRLLQNVLKGAADFIRPLSIGLTDFVSGVLSAVSAAAPAMEHLGAALGFVFSQLGNTLNALADDGTVTAAVDGFATTVAGLGEVAAPVVDLLIQMGAALGDSLGVVLKQLGTAVGVMTPGMVSLAVAVGDILTAASPLLPVIGRLANEGFTALAAQVQAAVPYVEAFARWASDNPDAISTIAQAVLGLAVAFKTLKVALTIKAAVDGAMKALGALATALSISRLALLGWGLAAAAAVDIAVGAFKGYSEEQKKAFQQGGFGDDINTFIKDFKTEPLQAIGKEIRESLTPPAETQGLWQKIAASFQTDFVDVFAAAPAKIKSSFQTDFLDVFTGLGSKISTSFQTDFVDVFANLPSTIGTALSGLGSTITAAASSAWTSLTTSAQTAVDTAVSFVTGLPGRIGAGLTSLGATIAAAAGTAWDSFVTYTQTKLDEAVAFVADLPRKIGFALGFLLVFIPTLTLTLWDSFVTTTQQKLDEGVAYVATLPGKVQAAMVSLGQIILAAGTAAWQWLVTTATTAFNATVTFVAGLPARIGAALSTLGAAIVSVASAAWASFTATVRAGADAAVAFVRSVPGMIGSALSALGSAIVSVATAAWNAFRNAVVAGVNAAVAFVRSVPGMISSALSALGGLLSSAATNAWNAFRNAVVAGTNAVIAFVRGIPGQVAAAIGNLGSALIGAGRALIDGLLTGIKQGVGSALAYARSIAGQIAAVKGPLSYDRTVLVPAGVALMQGLKAGMQTGLDDVLALASTAAGSISGALGGSSPLGGGLSVSAPNQTAAALQQLLTTQSSTPVEVTVLLDGQPVRDIARTEINSTSRATRRTVLAGAGNSF